MQPWAKQLAEECSDEELEYLLATLERGPAMKQTKLKRLHERQRASVDKEITLLTRIIERDDVLADTLAFLLELKPHDAKTKARRDELISQMTKVIQ